MSQKVRKNGSPTSCSSPVSSNTAGGNATGASATGAGGLGMSLFSRLLPMKATVPFQLKPQGQPPLQPRSAHGTNTVGGSPSHSNGSKCHGSSSSAHSRSPTRGVACGAAGPIVSLPPPVTPGTSQQVIGVGAHIVAQSSSSSSPCRSSPVIVATGSTLSRQQSQSPVTQSQCQNVGNLHMNTHSPTSGNVVPLPMVATTVGPPGCPYLQQSSGISDVPPSLSPTTTPPQPSFLSTSPCGASSMGKLMLPDHEQQSSGRTSPCSPGSKGRVPVVMSMSHTSSLEALAGPYLLGHWPRDSAHPLSPTHNSQLGHAHTGPCMKDQATQTPSMWVEEGMDKRSDSHKRSASWGSTDQLKEIAKLRQQLQRSKHSRHHRDKERKSPFNGSHTLINSTQAPFPKSALIPVPMVQPRPSPRLRNSLEGLNQEIERIIIRDVIAATAGDTEQTHTLTEVPDGRRAPPPLCQHSVNTQTASNHSNSSGSSRSHSVSPSFPSGNSDDSPGFQDNVLNDGREKDVFCGSPLPKYASSPKPNNSYMFMREPPEGCEKIKVFDETHLRPPNSQHQDQRPLLGPDRNKVNFVPKSGSAFLLLRQPLLPGAQEAGLKGPMGSNSSTTSSSGPPSAPPNSLSLTATANLSTPSSSSSSSSSTNSSCSTAVVLMRCTEEREC